MRSRLHNLGDPIDLSQDSTKCGLRLSHARTLTSDLVWYEANSYFGRGLVVSSIVSAAAVLVLFCIKGLSPEQFLKASLAAMVVPPAVPVLMTLRFIKSIT